jgi:hypothetical protein
VTDRSIYCHMTLSAMNYLLYIIYISIIISYYYLYKYSYFNGIVHFLDVFNIKLFVYGIVFRTNTHVRVIVDYCSDVYVYNLLDKCLYLILFYFFYFFIKIQYILQLDAPSEFNHVNGVIIQFALKNVG